MTLQGLKNLIEEHAAPESILVFLDKGDGFLSTHYLNELVARRDYSVEYVDTIDKIIGLNDDFFGANDNTNTITVLRTDELSCSYYSICAVKNAIIITKKITSTDFPNDPTSCVVEFPSNIEKWWVQDYAHSVLDGADSDDINYLCDAVGGNLYRLQNEIDKLLPFHPAERKYLLKGMISDGAFDDVSNNTVFNLSNAILSKEVDKVSTLMQEVDKIGVTDFGLLSILQTGFKNLVMIQLNRNPTPENTGIDSKKLFMMKKLPVVYTPEQLVSILKFLSDIDKKVKFGELQVPNLIDYIVVKVMSM